jgi:hypothetical protein
LPEVDTIEFRVVFTKAGINSCDYYFSLDRAVERAAKLEKLGTVCVQARTVSEWKDVSARKVQDGNSGTSQSTGSQRSA